MARYEETFTYATRGLGKTTCVVSDRCNKGILWPGEIIGYYAPSYTQAAPLASKAFATYARNTPLLADHWTVNNDSKESFTLTTTNASKFTMVLPRGMDTSSLVAEECGQEDGTEPFDWDDFNQIALGTNRKEHKINGMTDPDGINLQVHYITSASRKENPAFSTCMQIREDMKDGKSAFAAFIPWKVAVLCRMKPFAYYAKLRKKLTAEQFARECEARCTGSVENPVIKDSTLTASRKLLCMESKHCGNPEVFYILGYDVSSRDIAGNAKTALCVIKCERQYNTSKWDHYRKSIVYVADARPPKSARDHALIIKKAWRDYTMENGKFAYVVVDARSYGQSVIERLHEDLGDGNPPFRTMNEDETYLELVMPDSVPCLYPMMATGNNGQDPNSDMMDYVEREMENGNLRLLTANLSEGTKSYKLKNGIKDDLRDIEIQLPYIKTTELCKQISNLKKKKTTTGYVEKAILPSIPKDMWSATLYACRIAHRIEKDELYKQNQAYRNPWSKEARKPTKMPEYDIKPRAIKRMGRLGIKR